MVTLFAWIYVAFLVLGAMGTILMIGRPRKAVTPDFALVHILITGLIIWMMLGLINGYNP